MNIVRLAEAEAVPIAIDARKMAVRSDLELIHLTLKPGEVLERHSNPFDVVFYVLAGEGELSVEDEQARVTADSTVQVAAGLQRGWSNTGDSPLRILVVKVLAVGGA